MNKNDKNVFVCGQFLEFEGCWLARFSSGGSGRTVEIPSVTQPGLVTLGQCPRYIASSPWDSIPARAFSRSDATRHCRSRATTVRVVVSISNTFQTASQTLKATVMPRYLRVILISDVALSYRSPNAVHGNTTKITGLLSVRRVV
ncbi:hypothetical protein VTK56DRAFT_3762 [Thermocarpiscus australiensis]